MKYQDVYDDLMKWLPTLDNYIRCEVVGSAVYRSDAKDLDVLVQIEGSVGDFMMEPGLEGFMLCGDYASDGSWCAIREGVVNLILVTDLEQFDAFVKASDVCNALKLPTKRERMIVYRVVRDGHAPDAAVKIVDEELAGVAL